MRFLHQTADPGQPGAQLWVMLPGAYMKPADFLDAGFAQALRQRGLPHDIALLDAELGEVADGSALRYLEDFLQSGAAAGYRRVCLLGISLGARLAMNCLARLAGGPGQTCRVDSAVLLAPYLGPRDVIAEVAAAGALARWLPGALPAGDGDRAIWQWLQQESGSGRQIFLGYGSEDRFASAYALMAQALPDNRVEALPGGHTWPVWTALWNNHLDRAYAR